VVDGFGDSFSNALKKPTSSPFLWIEQHAVFEILVEVTIEHSDNVRVEDNDVRLVVVTQRPLIKVG
jgi:hypothetical protein